VTGLPAEIHVIFFYRKPLLGRRAMAFTSWLPWLEGSRGHKGRTQRRSYRKSIAPQKRFVSRLRLQVLEDRLPPGDWMLGALLGGSLGAPGLFAGSSDSWTMQDEPAGVPAAAGWEVQPDHGTARETGGLALAPAASVVAHNGQGAPDQGPQAGTGADVAFAQSNFTSADEVLFDSVLTNPLSRGGSTGHEPASVVPVPAPVGATTSAAASGQSINGGLWVAPPPEAQGAGLDLAALGFYAGLPATKAESTGPAGRSLSLQAETPAVHALFDVIHLDTTTASPFPTNRFTIADQTQNTGLQVNLPSPDPTMHPSDFQDIQVINTLDGFNIQPRLSIPFDGLIDVKSVNSQDVFLINLRDTVDQREHGSHTVGINQIVLDPASTTLHVESDQLLSQHTRYALIVTNGVLDANEQPVQASDAFTDFRHDLNFGQTKDPALKEYRKDLLQATEAAKQLGIPEQDIVTESFFTTQSVTATLQKIHYEIGQVDAFNPELTAASFDIGQNGEHTVFDLSQVTGITLKQQISVSGSLTTAPSPLPLLGVIPGAVGQVALGKFSSPDFEVHPGEYIPAVGTRSGMPAIQGYNDIYFDVYLPSGPRPEGGWPVIIATHGGGGNKDGLFGGAVGAAEAAAHGIATIAINAVGHGYGPNGTLTISQVGGGSVTLPAGGRGINQNGDSVFGAAEGYEAASPQAIISQRDGRLQTDADLMQLVRVIQAGVSVNGDGEDLDPSRVYYFGASLGSQYGAPFLAVEPGVRAGVLNTVGEGQVIRRLGVSRAGAGGGLTTPANFLASHVPSLINPPGSLVIKSLDGLATGMPYFNENLPLRDGVPLTVVLTPDNGPTTTTQIIQSPVTNTVAGAIAIQQFFENWEWVTQSGNPTAYAPYLRKDPLPGVPVRPVMIQFAKGDQNVVNPSTTAFLRAGDLADRATYYRYDLALNADNTLKKLAQYPHTFVGLITSPNSTAKAVALAGQEQIATFFASDGTEIIQPPGVPQQFFEVPIQGPLPEGLNYIV
jgi:hypothetical protein